MADVDVSEELNEVASQDQAKAAAEADLIPGGRYRFQMESYTPEKSDREYFDEAQTEKNPWYGVTRLNLRLQLTAKRDLKGKDAQFEMLERPRVYFQRVSPKTVLNSRGEISIESRLFGQMINVVTKAQGGQPTNKEVLDYFQNNMAEITITLTEGNDKYPDPKNFVKSIKALEA